MQQKNSKLSKLIVVDDEIQILKSLERLLRKDYEITVFDNGQDALDYMERHSVDIILSDMRMPHMLGSEFLAKARAQQPKTVRLLLTGYSDMDSTVEAINEGGVFSYIAKPWDNDKLKEELCKAENKRKLEQEKELLANQLSQNNKCLKQVNVGLEKTVEQRNRELSHSHKILEKKHQAQKDVYQKLITMLTSMIEMRYSEKVLGYSQRVAAQSRLLAKRMGLPKAELTHIYLGSLIHEIGLLTMDMPVKKNVSEFTESELMKFNTHPQYGGAILERLPGFQIVSEIIKHQFENVDGSGTPDHLTQRSIPIGARILRVVKAYNEMISGKFSSEPVRAALAKAELQSHRGEYFDDEVVQRFIDMLEQRRTLEDGDSVEYYISLDELQAGDVLKEDLVAPHNKETILLAANHQITEANLTSLREYENKHNKVLAVVV